MSEEELLTLLAVGISPLSSLLLCTVLGVKALVSLSDEGHSPCLFLIMFMDLNRTLGCFVNFFSGGAQLGVLRAYSWVLIQGSLLVGLGDYTGYWGLNQGWLHASQVPYPLYYAQSPNILKFLTLYSSFKNLIFY